MKTFAGETALNSASILPGKPYVLVGGGQEAMSVTTTSARQGGFEIRFWHRVFEEEVGRVKGGFGPCNTLVFLSRLFGLDKSSAILNSARETESQCTHS